MEGVEDVQAQTVAETSQGVGSAEAEPSSSVSAAEPVAPEPTQSQEPAAEAQEVSSGNDEVIQESFPDVDSFSWDEWDGEDYEAFPEQVRGWANKLGTHYSKRADSLTTKHNQELDYWKRMYEALQYGDEDPRIAEMTSQIEQMTTENKAWEEKLAALEKEINTEREEENARYFSWFEKNYEGKLEQLAENYGAEAAEAMVLDLMDLGMEVHLAVEISLMGKDAAATAKDLASKVADPSIILELMNSRYNKTNTNTNTNTNVQEVKVEEKPANPAAQVVAGSAPVSRPAQLQKEKAPAYGSSNQRMASLLNAAENAIRKSKRR